MALKPYQSNLAVWLLVALPGLFAVAWLTPADLSTPASKLNLLGRLTGIWGLACLLVAAMLCCRVPGFDQPFGGLTKLWQLHHRIGITGFLFLLAHPLLLSLAAAEVSIQAAADTLFSHQWPVLWGWAALVLLMLVMAPTLHILGEPDYQRWKQMHRLGAITVVFALIHSLMLGRSLPGVSSEVIWSLLALLALSAIGYRWIISRCYCHPYQVSKVVHLSGSTVEISLLPLKTQLHYRAGQFVYLTPHAPELTTGNGEEHPYTLSSAPSEPELRIAIKSLGDASRALQRITVGSQVTIEGPYGRFFPAKAHHTNSLWIAGGIGIVPFLSYLRHCAIHQDEYLNTKLIYCVQDEAHMIFADELQQLTSIIHGCHLTPHFFYRDGPLSAEFIQQHCPDLSSRQVWICGPAPLIARSRQIIRSAGVSAHNIITEEFTLL